MAVLYPRAYLYAYLYACAANNGKPPAGLALRPCCPVTSACPSTPADRHDNRARPAPGPLLRPGLHPCRAVVDPLPGGIAAYPPCDRRRGLRRPVLVPRRLHAERHDRPRRPLPDARLPAVTLPPPRNGNGNCRHPRHGPAGSSPFRCRLTPPPPSATSARSPSPSSATSWLPGVDQLIRDHHYLCYTPLAGAQIRYLATTPAAGTSPFPGTRGRMSCLARPFDSAGPAGYLIPSLMMAGFPQ